MNITKDSAVTLTYKVTTPQGKPLDSGNLAYLHGGYENIFPKVEAALEGQAVGFATTLDLAVEDAFGARDESLVRTIPKSEFPPGTPVIKLHRLRATWFLHHMRNLVPLNELSKVAGVSTAKTFGHLMRYLPDLPEAEVFALMTRR